MARKYLIGDEGGTLYTVSDDTLVEVEGDITASLFTEYGIDSIPDSDVLMELVNPKVYCWQDAGTPSLTAAVTGLPYPQVVRTGDIDMSDVTITGIESVEITGDDDTLFAVSADGGDTWYNYVSSAWTQLSADTSGQTKSDIEAISTTAWAEFAVTGSIMFRFVLSSASNYVEEIRINYLNTSSGVSTQRILLSITVKALPTKQIYTLGETLDLTGISIIAAYDNSTKADVTNGCKYGISDGDTLTETGSYEITVSYTESGVTQSAAFTITVNE